MIQFVVNFAFTSNASYNNPLVGMCYYFKVVVATLTTSQSIFITKFMHFCSGTDSKKDARNNGSNYSR